VSPIDPVSTTVGHDRLRPSMQAEASPQFADVRECRRHCCAFVPTRGRRGVEGDLVVVSASGMTAGGHMAREPALAATSMQGSQEQ